MLFHFSYISGKYISFWRIGSSRQKKSKDIACKFTRRYPTVSLGSARQNSFQWMNESSGRLTEVGRLDSIAGFLLGDAGKSKIRSENLISHFIPSKKPYMPVPYTYTIRPYRYRYGSGACTGIGIGIIGDAGKSGIRSKKRNSIGIKFRKILFYTIQIPYSTYWR